MRQSKKLIILEITNTVQNEDPVTSNLKLAPVIKIATPEHLHPIIYKMHSKCTISNKTTSLHNNQGKITQDQAILSILRGAKSHL